MIDGQNLIDQPVKSNLRTYDYIRKVATGQGDDYTVGCLLYYPYFKEHYQLIAIDLSKQTTLDVDPKAILKKAEGATMFFIPREGKETELDFSKGTVEVLYF